MPAPAKREPDFSIIDGIDRVIHEPARLAIMVHLSVVESADFLYLKVQTGLTWGNLSSHITKLETAGYIQIEKKFIDRKPQTVIHLTDAGRAAFRVYQQRMKHLFEDQEKK
jgi:DNA-binding MarR family transcriptional regulator